MPADVFEGGTIFSINTLFSAGISLLAMLFIFISSVWVGAKGGNGENLSGF
jgi:hypothetical protein